MAIKKADNSRKIPELSALVPQGGAIPNFLIQDLNKILKFYEGYEWWFREECNGDKIFQSRAGNW